MYFYFSFCSPNSEQKWFAKSTSMLKVVTMHMGTRVSDLVYDNCRTNYVNIFLFFIKSKEHYHAFWHKYAMKYITLVHYKVVALWLTWAQDFIVFDNLRKKLCKIAFFYPPQKTIFICRLLNLARSICTTCVRKEVAKLLKWVQNCASCDEITRQD